MKTNTESVRIEDLLEEADELIRQINADVFKNLQEEHRLQFEGHAKNLEKIKSKVQSKTEKVIGSEAESMHAAILDIVKAMSGLKKDIS